MEDIPILWYGSKENLVYKILNYSLLNDWQIITKYVIIKYFKYIYTFEDLIRKGDEIQMNIEEIFDIYMYKNMSKWAKENCNLLKNWKTYQKEKEEHTRRLVKFFEEEILPNL